MAFPTSPTNGDLHSEFGRSYQYVADTSSWRAATSPAPEITISTVTAFESAVDLPLVNNNPGDTTFIAADNSFRLWTGSGWFEIALVNTAPTITTGANATYTLAKDGTPTIVTLAATDPEGTPVVWGHLVTSGSLEDTTVTNVDNVFTITPGTIAATFDLSFTASDGVNIDTSASSFTLSFGPDWSATALVYTLDNPNAYGSSAYDYFGAGVAVEGEYALVGAYGEADASGDSNSGKVYIFSTSTGSLLYTLTNPNPVLGSGGDSFSRGAVDVSGNYGIVGALGERVTNTQYTSGAAYIYDMTTGSLMHTLLNPNPYSTPTDDQFGQRVAISGNYAIVAAPFEDAVWSNSGIVYVYNVTTGALVHTLLNPRTEGVNNNKFGTSVAIDGDYVVISAPFAPVGAVLAAGVAYIFNVTTGALIHTIDAPTPTEYWQFGSDVDISGNYAVMTAPNASSVDGTTYSGKMYIYNVTTGALVHTIENPNAYGSQSFDLFGYTSVSMDGNYCAVVAANEGSASFASGMGIVYIFDVTTGQLVKTIENPSPVQYSNFGSEDGIGISGSTLVIGSAGWSDGGVNGIGKAYIFQAG